MNSKGTFLTPAACVLLLAACGPDRPPSEVRLVRADVGRIESPDVTREQVAQRGTGATLFLGQVTDPSG